MEMNQIVKAPLALNHISDYHLEIRLNRRSFRRRGFRNEDYGRTWRLWIYPPTEEDSEGMPWMSRITGKGKEIYWEAEK